MRTYHTRLGGLPAVVERTQHRTNSLREGDFDNRSDCEDSTCYQKRAYHLPLENLGPTLCLDPQVRAVAPTV